MPTSLTADAPWPRLDHFLTARLAGLSRTVIQSLIKGGRVQVDGETVLKAREPLAGGEHISVGAAPREPSRLVPQEM
ncbi:MAG: S4 domain-containing protein, partial [Candidatus Neomarinimicrobiota bacterium]